MSIFHNVYTDQCDNCKGFVQPEDMNECENRHEICNDCLWTYGVCPICERENKEDNK
jgi:hypothetical protein